MGIGSMASLHIGVSGLQSNQTALNTTAHNLSNVDTDGYVRQQVILKDTLYRTYGYTAVSTKQVGIGTAIETVRQVRDEFMDKQYRFELGKQSYYSTQYYVVSEIEQYFGEMEGKEFNEALLKFSDALQEVQKDPSDGVKRSTLIDLAGSLVDRSKLIYTQLEDYQVNLNQQLMDQVDAINTAARQIEEYNKQISKVETAGEHANDIRDERNKLIDKLASYGEIKYQENDIGVVTVLFEGKPLVTEDSHYEIGTKKLQEGSELLKPVWPSYGDLDVVSLWPVPTSGARTDVGSLKGLLMARGNRTGNFTDLQSEDYTTQTQPFAITNTQALLDNLIHNIVTTLNDIICPNTELTQDITLVGADGSPLMETVEDANGNMVQKPMKLSAGTLVLDVANAPRGLGDNGKPGEELFSRDGVSRYTEYQYKDSNGELQTLYVYNPEKTKEDPANSDDKPDEYTWYSIKHLKINQNVIDSPDRLPLLNPDGSVAQDVVNKLISAWSGSEDYPGSLVTLNPNTMTKLNFSQYYTALIGDIADRGESFNKITLNQELVVQQTDNKRQQVAGVNSDEELSNMMMYQHAYNAASRFFNVVNEMLETLIRMM